MDMRKQQRVTHPVERLSQLRKRLGHRPEKRGQPLLRCQPVARRQPEAASPHRVVVVEVGTAAPPVPVRDVVREETAQPQGVVPQVHPREVRPVRVGALDLRRNARQRVVQLVVVLGQLAGSLPQPEVQQDAGHVVGQRTVPRPQPQQGVTHDHVADEGQRRMRRLPGADELREQLGLVEQRVESVVGELALEAAHALGAAAAEQAEHQVGVIAAEPATYVGKQHDTPPEASEYEGATAGAAPQRRPTCYYRTRCRAERQPLPSPVLVLFIGVPSHNEATTVGVLLWRLRTVLAEVSREYEVVVYDDASTDGTTDVLAPYARVLPLTLLRGERRVGTAGAMDAIVRHVVRTTRYPRRDGLLFMQADFTDAPTLVPEFLRRFEGGADLIIGERRPAPDAPQSVRRLMTAARWVLRPFVGITDVRDLTTSFRLARVAVLRDLLKATNDAPVCTGDGWTAQAELLLNLAPHARRIETIPVTPSFAVRTRETRRQAWPDTVALARWAWQHRGLRIAAKVIARDVEAGSEPSEVAEAIEEDRLARAERNERADARRESPREASARAGDEGRRRERQRERTRDGGRAARRGDEEPRSDSSRSESARDARAERRSERGPRRRDAAATDGGDAVVAEEPRRGGDAEPRRRGRRTREDRERSPEQPARDAAPPGVTLPSGELVPADALHAASRDDASVEGPESLEDGREADEARRSRRRRRRRGKGAAAENASGEREAGGNASDEREASTDDASADRSGGRRGDAGRDLEGDRGGDAASDQPSADDDEGEAGSAGPRRRRRARRGRRRGGDGVESPDGQSVTSPEDRAEGDGPGEEAGGPDDADANDRAEGRRRRGRRGRRGGRRRAGGEGGSEGGGDAGGDPGRPEGGAPPSSATSGDQ